MRRTVSILAAAAVAFAGSLALGAPASAATPSLRFHGAQYDSPGKDTRSNASLNAEYVRLTNKTRKTVNLKGWTIRDVAGTVYTVRTDQKLAAGATAYVHSGKGTNGRPDAKHRYWNRTNYVWNNSGDTAYLRSPSGKSIDTCKWTSNKNQTYC